MEAAEFTLPSELVEEFAKGNGVIWLGAGCTVGSGLPTWEGLIKNMSQRLLAEKIATEYELKYSLNMLETAQLFRNIVGDHYYYKFLRSELSAKTASSIHTAENITLEAVTGLINHLWPKPGLVTVSTNFDALLEDRLLQFHGKKARTIITRDDVATLDLGNELTIVKPNGDINHPASIILTLEDYCEYRLRKPEFVSFLSDLMTKKTFLFVGYGLGDFTFNSLLGELKVSLGPFKRKAFALMKSRKEVEREVYRSLGVEIISISDYDDIPFILRAIAQQQTTVELVVKKIARLPRYILDVLSKSKLLLVDDDVDLAQTISWVFQHYDWKGFEVISDPKKAVQLINEKKFDFIITDFAMPGLTGIDIIKATRKSKRNRRSITVVWSGFAEEDRCFEAGADYYFEKPAGIDEIFRMLVVLRRMRDGAYLTA